MREDTTIVDDNEEEKDRGDPLGVATGGGHDKERKKGRKERGGRRKEGWGEVPAWPTVTQRGGAELMVFVFYFIFLFDNNQHAYARNF